MWERYCQISQRLVLAKVRCCLLLYIASFSYLKTLNDHEYYAVTMQAANERLIELQKGGGSNEMYLQQEGHLASLAEEIALLATVKQQLEDAITVSVAKGLHFAVKTGDGDTVSSS